ncbi:hypothetical protein QJS04_geneDACA012010 [Acorus gramineus]|uniref:Uncharacterized protein n=1 Tax=Acorus gramineus TaxID=55184 RepID=A0AAV9AFL0_ACOGR|nr:hypothetical protein QJS04_geneDACA012010 [Acorus gramineus]
MGITGYCNCCRRFGLNSPISWELDGCPGTFGKDPRSLTDSPSPYEPHPAIHNPLKVAANMLHLARIAMFKFDHIRRVELDKARDELDRATNHLDDSMRISRLVLDRFNENKGRIQSKGAPKEDERGRHIALIILLQSIDTKVRLETAKSELQESKVKDAHPIEAERAFRECISLFKESGLRRALLNSRDVQLEYLSCLKHLLSLMTGSGESQQSRETVQGLRDEIKRVEAMLSPSRKHGN